MVVTIIFTFTFTKTLVKSRLKLLHTQLVQLDRLNTQNIISDSTKLFLIQFKQKQIQFNHKSPIITKVPFNDFFNWPNIEFDPAGLILQKNNSVLFDYTIFYWTNKDTLPRIFGLGETDQFPRPSNFQIWFLEFYYDKNTGGSDCTGTTLWPAIYLKKVNQNTLNHIIDHCHII